MLITRDKTPNTLTVVNFIEMLNVGFDPVFIDVITKIYSRNGVLAENIPPVGDHHPWSQIKIIPGGNGFNFARSLNKKTKNVVFWGKIDKLYETLVNLEEPTLQLGKLIFESEWNSNITVALETKKGELQINSTKYGVSPEDIGKKARNALAQTKVATFLNIGLNSTWYELFKKISEILISENKQLEVSLFDPSTLKSFNNWSNLKNWFINYYANISGIKIISLNEFEAEKIKNHISLEIMKKVTDYLIVHTAKRVTIYSENGKRKINVPSLKQQPITHVGVGDTFNAGLVSSLLKKEKIEAAIESGIKSAQELMIKGWDGLN